MTKPILYGIEPSPPVRAVFLTAAAIGLDYEFQEVNVLSKEQLSPEYLKKNPQHTIPTLEDNGNFIWDSHAIIAYLVGKYAKDDSLYPKDLYKRALIDQRLHFDSGILFPRMRESVGTIVVKKLRSTIPPHLIEGINEGYNFLETFLENGNYMVGNSLTIADFSLVASVSTVSGLVPLSPEKHSKVLAWIKRMESLPYYEKANAIGAKKLVALVKNVQEELKAQNL